MVLSVRGFSRKCQAFAVSEKMYLQTFFVWPKVIDQIMGLCIKIKWCKNHDNILFGQCENTFTIIFCMLATLMVHPRIKKTHKNHLGDIPNIFNTNC